MLDSMKIYHKGVKPKRKRIEVKKVRKISKYVYNKLVFIFSMIVLALFFLSVKIYDIQINFHSKDMIPGIFRLEGVKYLTETVICWQQAIRFIIL